MKKSLIAVAVLAASGAAMAQSSVTLYGIVDAWIGSKQTNGVTVVNGNQLATTELRQTGVNSGGLSSSRWGLKGSEDLGGGLKAIFALESGINVDTGESSDSKRLFDRQAFVGLTSGFGTVSLGRQNGAYESVRGTFFSAQGNSPSFDATNGKQFSKANIDDLAAFDRAVVPTTAQATAAAAALNTKGVAASRIGAWAGYQARVDNSIRYATPSISGFQAAVVYGFGEDKNTVAPTYNNGATKNASISLSYANGPIGVAVVHQDDELSPDFHMKNTGVGGYYDFGVAKAFLAYNEAKYDGFAKQNEWAVGVRAPLGATTLVAQYAQSKGDDFGKNTSFGLSAEYSLSKRTTAYAGFNQTKVEILNDNKNNAFGLGVRHTF
ncbi:porin [Polaromonas sp.]|uniref:porin n=1 Tax=Polaromonas sp. TaxID=1869339 RepID=UPI003BB74385